MDCNALWRMCVGLTNTVAEVWKSTLEKCLKDISNSVILLTHEDFKVVTYLYCADNISRAMESELSPKLSNPSNVFYFLISIKKGCLLVCLLAYILHISGSTLNCWICRRLSAEDACTNRQVESAAALSSIHWNACIKNGA